MEGLKDFVLKTLSAHNCEADSDALANYIVALVENGVKDSAEFTEHLQVFLYDSTESFVKELVGFVEALKPDIEERAVIENDCDNAPDNSDNEVVVDYEEGSSLEAVSNPHINIQRPLREYSPERVSEKRPCTNFGKYGNCRFGDNCRYAHIAQPGNNPARRRQVSTRVKLSNIPSSVLNPAELTATMCKYGNVINVTVYPEKGEASVQFATGEEALEAVEGVVNDLEIEGAVAELETLKPSKPLQKDDSKLKFLINLQTQQQTLLETNLSTQTTLLGSLMTAPSEELLATLKRVQESGRGLEGMLKKTGEMIERASETRECVVDRRSGDKRSSRSHQHQHQQQHYQPQQYQSQFRPQQYRPSYNANTSKWPSAHYNNYNGTGSTGNIYNSAAYRPSTHARPNTLDLRPTTLKLSPLPSTNLTDIHALQRHFSPFGPLQSLIISDAGTSAVIKYQKHGDAQKAFERVGKEFEGVEGVEFEFIRQ